MKSHIVSGSETAGRDWLVTEERESPTTSARSERVSLPHGSANMREETMLLLECETL